MNSSPLFRDRLSPFVLSATVDFPDDVGYGAYTFELLDELVARLKAMGVQRIYWLYYGDIHSASYWAGAIYQWVKNGPQTLNNIGEPLKAAVPIAHRHGLELFGVLKPYHTGGSDTFPEGSPRADATSITRIGGTLQYVSPFTERYPQVRVRRRPVPMPHDLPSLPVTRIRLLKKDYSPTRIRKENLEIWTSPDNYQYRRKSVQFTLQETVVPAPQRVYDYYGDLLTDQGAPVRALTLGNLDLKDRYILLTTNFKDHEGDFENTALGMLQVYGPNSQQLPIVVATRSAMYKYPRDFRTYGLEFDSGLGPLRLTLDVNNTLKYSGAWWSTFRGDGAIAFARGRNDYLPTTPCEVYPEVRQLWRGWVGRMIDAGVDGIDVRVSAHGSLVDEPDAYGFNQPVLEAFQQQFGEEFTGEGSDLHRLAQLRGQHFTAFVRETSRRLRQLGKKMQVHLHTEAFRPNPCHGQLMGFPANIQFDWQSWLTEGLVDGVTLRTSWFEAFEDLVEGHTERSRLAGALKDPVVEQALKLTQELRLPVYMNRYLGRAIGTEEYATDLEQIFHDERFAGFDVYETVDILRPARDRPGLEIVKDRFHHIQTKAQELGIF